MSQNLRFLLVTWDGAGNLPPEFRLVRELSRRGHEVDVIAQACLQSRIESAGGRLLPTHFVSQWSSTDKIMPEEEGLFYWNNCVFARAYADETMAALQTNRYDAVLVDSFLPYAIAAARASGIPTVALVHSLYDTLITGPMADAVDAGLQGASAEFDEFGIGPIISFRQLIEGTDEVLVFSYRDFDNTEATGISHVGPLRVAKTTQESPRRFPDRPLLVVGLSTAFQSQGVLLQRICDALGDLTVEAIVTTGPAIEPESLRAPDNVLVVQFTEHDNVLPDADLLITHAGHGTVMSGVQYGVPMLCLPMGRDQPVVAARVAELGLGRVLEPDSSAQEIREAVAHLIEDNALRSTSREFAKQLDTDSGLERAAAIAESAAR